MAEKKTMDNDGKITSGKNISYWLDSVEPIKFNPLRENLIADVAIIGGGIAGVAAAYMLSKEKYKVVLLEDGFIGSGETGRTTAHLVNALDDRYFDLEKYFDEEGIKLAAESHTAAIETAEKICREEKIDCDFMRLTGYLFLHPSDDKKTLEEELKASNRAGIGTVLLNDPPGLENYKGPALSFPGQAIFHPLKFLKGLCDAIIRNGGKIFTETRAEEIKGNNILTKEGLRVNADHIIIATNTPVFNRFVIHTKQAPYRTYVIAGKVQKGKLPGALWWDTGDHNSEWPTWPYHYVRLQNYDNEFDLLIAGGEDHKTAQQDEENISEKMRFKNLEEWTRKHFPAMEEIIYNWSGQVMEPIDGMAFIGKNPMDADNVYIATGDSGNGITHGILAGMILTDIISGRKNKWEDLYDPSRKTLKAADVFIEEQANVVKQYMDYFTPGDIEELKDLKNDTGAVIRNGASKAAVYRDQTGKLFTFSAVCPHLMCIIQWNREEKTFDCPCHGSRFNCYGEVINGPANKDLDKVEL